MFLISEKDRKGDGTDFSEGPAQKLLPAGDGPPSLASLVGTLGVGKAPLTGVSPALLLSHCSLTSSLYPGPGYLFRVTNQDP